MSKDFEIPRHVFCILTLCNKIDAQGLVSDFFFSYFIYNSCPHTMLREMGSVPVTKIGVMPNKISVNIIIGKYLTEFAQTKCR